jgi:predicted N-formylglutamate amidohydrolase
MAWWPSMSANSSSSFEIVNTDGDPRILLVCDHASNAVPGECGTLGLPGEAFRRHIAYDIGAAAVTRALARLLNAPAVLACFSRLLIDANRGEDDPTLVMKLSDGAVIPGNRDADDAETARRLDRFYRPYHAAIAARIADARDRNISPALLSIHSFTPVWKGWQRPWHYGVLWDKDGRLALPLLRALDRSPGVVAGNNQPYSGELRGDCMNRHGTQNGLPHVLVEIRQDMIADEAGVARVSAFLAPHLRAAVDGLTMSGD